MPLFLFMFFFLNCVISRTLFLCLNNHTKGVDKGWVRATDTQNFCLYPLELKPWRDSSTDKTIVLSHLKTIFTSS